MKDKVLEDIQNKLDALTYKDTLQNVSIVCPNLPEWDLISFIEIYWVPNIYKYHRKSSPINTFPTSIRWSGML